MGKFTDMRNAVVGAVMGAIGAGAAGNAIAGEEQNVGAALDAELNNDNATTHVQEAASKGAPQNYDMESNTLTVSNTKSALDMPLDTPLEPLDCSSTMDKPLDTPLEPEACFSEDGHLKNTGAENGMEHDNHLASQDPADSNLLEAIEAVGGLDDLLEQADEQLGIDKNKHASLDDDKTMV